MQSIRQSVLLAFGVWWALTVLPVAAAQTAELVYPRSIALDEKGRIYVADSGICAVLRVQSQGPPIVVARGECLPQTPFYSLTGIAVSRSGIIAVSETGTSNVYRIADGKPVPITLTDPAKNPFGMPRALAFDTAGNLIVLDLGLNAILRVSDGKATTVALVEVPSGACVDKTGAIVVISASKKQLVRVAPGGKVTTIAQGPPFESPLAVTASADGTYVVADGYAGAIFRVTSDGNVSVLANGGPLKYPNGVAAEASGSFVVADPQAKAVFRVSPEGKVTTVYASK
jgi:hypothetical protein